jgi:hypothetical protein
VIKIKCVVCKKNVAAGAAAAKMIVEYSQPDGTVKIFGYMMSDGPLGAATGRMLRGYHSKCFWVLRKREQKGNAVSGRVLSAMPTAYEIGDLVLTADEVAALGLTPEQAREQSTASLAEHIDKLRELSRSVGKPIGDPAVQEARLASERGGPYPHTHHLPLDAYQLRPHLHYAHGLDLPPLSGAGYQATHDEVHAITAMEQIEADRAADLGYQQPRESDWREHVVADVEHLRKEHHAHGH